MKIEYLLELNITSIYLVGKNTKNIKKISFFC